MVPIHKSSKKGKGKAFKESQLGSPEIEKWADALHKVLSFKGKDKHPSKSSTHLSTEGTPTSSQSSVSVVITSLHQDILQEMREVLNDMKQERQAKADQIVKLTAHREPSKSSGKKKVIGCTMRLCSN